MRVARQIALEGREDAVKAGYAVIPVDGYGFTLEGDVGSCVSIASRAAGGPSPSLCEVVRR